MEQADLIWMNGEFVAWEDAKVHVLTHGLHYGTGVFEGVRCYDTEIGPGGLPPRRPHRPPLQVGRAVLHADPVRRASSCARRRSSSSAATACAPATSARSSSAATGTMGLFPLDAPVDVRSPTWEWGAYLGEEGKRNGVRAKVSSWRRISRDSLIPHAKASGQYLNSILAKIESPQGRLRGGDPPRRPRLRLRGLGREHLRRARGRDRARRRRRPSILDGINRKSCMQIARDLGFEVVERDIARAELYLADEVFMTGTAAELVAVREVDDHAVGTGKPGRDHPRGADDVRGRPARAQRALPRVAGPGADRQALRRRSANS